jgi:hypothetical protein
MNPSQLERTLSGPHNGGVEPIFRPPPRAGYNPDMSILIPGLVVAFAAFCVWLAVRIVNRQERWAKRTALGLFVVLVGYPLSIGPACWFSSRVGCGATIVTVIYRPLLGFVPTPATGMLEKYSAIASAPNWSWEHSVPTVPPGGRPLRIFVYWDRERESDPLDAHPFLTSW